MDFDFDRRIDRSDVGSLKWTSMRTGVGKSLRYERIDYFQEDSPLPLWLGDMDFPPPPPVLVALEERVKHGVFGYTVVEDSYYQEVAKWMSKRQGWAAKPEWITVAPGVVPALHYLISALTKPGKKVLVQTPVYYPFFIVVERAGCTLVTNSLIIEGDRYVMDFDDLEAKAADPEVEIAILCSPHNPVGRVWSQEELERFASICSRNGVAVISDEIHGDLIYFEKKFIPYAEVGDESSTVICTAPSKTFNLAGLNTSNIIIPNSGLRIRFQQSLKSASFPGVNPFGLIACQAAYQDGESWLDALLKYLEGNLTTMIDFFNRELPQVKVFVPEATYLIWCDFRALNLEDSKLKEFFLNQARVVFDDGYIFGQEGSGFERINIGSPRQLLEEGLQRIAQAVHRLSR